MFRPLPINQEKFVALLEKDIARGFKRDRRHYERLANVNGIADKNVVKELMELAIVRKARVIARDESETFYERYQKIVELYNNQVNLSMRTSQSVLLQQYSTPAPIGFLAGVYTGAFENHITVFEPSAGNGLLTITADPKTLS